jgi:hypothetical protein
MSKRGGTDPPVDSTGSVHAKTNLAQSAEFRFYNACPQQYRLGCSGKGRGNVRSMRQGLLVQPTGHHSQRRAGGPKQAGSRASKPAFRNTGNSYQSEEWQVGCSSHQRPRSVCETPHHRRDAGGRSKTRFRTTGDCKGEGDERRTFSWKKHSG